VEEESDKEGEERAKEERLNAGKAAKELGQGNDDEDETGETDEIDESEENVIAEGSDEGDGSGRVGELREPPGGIGGSDEETAAKKELIEGEGAQGVGGGGEANGDGVEAEEIGGVGSGGGEEEEEKDNGGGDNACYFPIKYRSFFVPGLTGIS
jgi:hypothetical protein